MKYTENIKALFNDLDKASLFVSVRIVSDILLLTTHPISNGKCSFILPNIHNILSVDEYSWPQILNETFIF